MFNQLSTDISAAWKRIVDPENTGKGELRAVFVLGTIIAGAEAGFVLPPVSSFFFGNGRINQNVCQTHVLPLAKGITI